MPLSKKRNRERMRKSRLHKHLCPPQEIRPVQPDNENVEMARRMLSIQMRAYAAANKPDIDADGQPIYENV